MRYVLLPMVLIALIFALGNVVLFNALPKPDRLKEPLVLEYGTSSEQFRRDMGLLLQQPVVSGNRIDLLQDGEAIYAAKLEAIANAEHSVTFEVYEYGGEQAVIFAEALAHAAERGVRVHALLDFLGSRNADPEAFERMEEAGVELVRWREPSWYQLSRFNHRTHRKLLVVDGHTGFIGGANVADPWVDRDDREGYRDNHFRIQGPVVGNLQAVFLETWLDATGRMPTGEAYFPALTERGDRDAQVVNSAPREGRHRVRLMFLHAIAAAEEHITIGTAYFYPDPRFLDALMEAADRGVHIRVLTPGDSMNFGFFRHASVNRWRPMLESGVELYEYRPRMYHSKLMAVDDRWASVGSANLHNRSFRLNDEANLSIWNEDFAREIRELIESDKADAERLTIEDWENRPLRRRLAGWITQLIGPYL
ncbi:phosphatidylserine/phosphatidylglycerophosphate/cardiolipin synthase family protein [Thioalkalivibrio sp. AKL19]|uniref:phospholipase D-like domain-containing protein n=1 Tax=Thioalkalivibrio sp. AKL19 TaxID=1266914 RepID=UPI00042526AF|nr:phospholipase D-like domain-containing protein [Thioalkalivibrio sp. AKL19]